MYFMDFYGRTIMNNPTQFYILEDEKTPTASICAMAADGAIEEMFHGDIDDVNKMYKAMWQAIKRGKNYFEFSLYHLREV